jgi:CTP-dependent riboflavin kinase
MKITVQSALNSLQILDDISKKVVVTSPKLYRMIARVQRELLRVSEAYEKAKNLLLRQMGRTDEKGQLQVLPDKLREFGEKLFEYLEAPEFVAVPGKIPLGMFEGAGVSLSSIELSVLDWLVLWNDKEDSDFVPSEG